MQLREPELRALLDCVAESASAPDLATFRERVMAGVRQVVPCDSVTYNEVDAVGRQVDWAADPSGAADLPDGPAIFARCLHEHPLIAHVSRTGDPQALRISDLTEGRAFRRLELYTDFFSPLGVEHQMAVVLRPARDRIVGVALDRSRRDFSDRERLKLDLLRGPLTRALGLVRARADAARRLAALQRGYVEGGRGVAVVGRDGRLDAVGDASERLLAGFAPVALADWVRTRPEAPLVVHGRSERLVARFVASGGAAADDDLVLFVCERDPLGDDALAAHGLTCREGEVLRHVASGATNDQIAALLHVSARTVQKHLEHVFSRLGVSTRMAAVAAVGAAPA